MCNNIHYGCEYCCIGECSDVAHLNWYYGGGAHIGFYNGNYVYWGNNGTTYTIIGIDGILGIEYTFSEIPINIGIDWKPALNLLSLIHISEPTRLGMISYAVFCLKK